MPQLDDRAIEAWISEAEQLREQILMEIAKPIAPGELHARLMLRDRLWRRLDEVLAADPLRKVLH